MYKTTTKFNSVFSLNMQLKSGSGRGFTCMTFGKCPYQNELVPEQRPFNISALLLLCFALRSRIVWISFYLKTSSLQPFSLFYDLIASYYTKGKWQWRQGYLFCFQSCHFDKGFFKFAYFSPFDLKSLLNDTHRDRLVSHSIQYIITGMAGWLLLMFFKCLHH